MPEQRQCFLKIVMTDFWVPVVAYTPIPQVVERHEVSLGQQYRAGM